MFGSSSPFGASTASPFGAPAAANPFGATSNPFGSNAQASNPFGAKPFGSTSSAFGAQTGSSLFGSGTSTGVFGATATPAFGAATTPAFGAFGQQKPASPFGGFGATQPQQNPFGSPSFGQSQPAFGSQPFGSTAPGFGAQSASPFGSTTTPLFGASAPAFGASSTPAFGASTTPAFGASSTPAFGASTSTPAFGAAAPSFGNSSVFGQSSPAFGASSTPAFGSTPAASPFGASSGSAFGSSFGASAFGGAQQQQQQQQQRVGSRVTPYAVTNDTDSGVGAQAGKFLCISAMPAYKDKQLEELRYEDYTAGDKGGPNPASAQPAAGGIFGQQQQQQQAPAAASPFGAASNTFGAAATPNPFGSTPAANPFGAKPAFGSPSTPAPAFGQSSTPAFGSSTFGASAFGAASTPAFGQASSSPAFGSTPSPFGQSSAASFGNSTFGSSTPSLFGQSSPAFGASSAPAFGSSTPAPAFGAQTSTPAFGGGNLFGASQPASSSGGLFGATTPAPQPFGASPAPTFGQSQGAFGSNLFGNTSTPGSLFGQTKPAGLTQSSSSSLFSGFGGTPATQNPTSVSFPNWQTPQQGTNNIFGGTPSAFGQQNSFGTPQPTQNALAVTQAPITNPFGTLPAMPQITIGRSSGSGPSVQYGISSMPVSEKPTQVRVNSLLTPRHITQRSKVRMHARRYHPKKDSQKVSFFSDGDEAPSTPKADVMFVPRENPRSLFIRQSEQPPLTPTAAMNAPDAREVATPVQNDGFHEEQIKDDVGGDSIPFSFPESPQTNWRSPDNVNGSEFVETPTVPQAKPSERATPKPASKMNGLREEHSHRGNGYISITGHRAGEAAIAYEHGADIEALMPKLRHSDYFTDPKVQELAALERADPSYCRRVKDFVVGRKGYGQIKFLGETDVRRLDLENIVQFNKCEVLVYMDETKKPAVGQGLNKAAEVRLLNVKCIDKKTGQHHAEGAEVEKFEKRLRKKTEEQEAEFLGYDGLKGEWRFRVKHFSRYGLDFESDEDEPDGGDEGALVLAGTYDMEGVEEGDAPDPDDSMFDTPLKNFDAIPEPGVGLDEEVGDEFVDASYFTAPQSALPHSLPAHLHLDPVKMQQMRVLFFAEGEEAEDIAPPGMYGRWQSRPQAPSPAVNNSSVFGSQMFKTPQKASPGEDADGRPAWPQRSSPWKGTPAKQMRVSPLTSWKRSPAYSALEEGMSGHQTPIMDVSPSRSPLLALTMGGERERSGMKRPRGSGFLIDPSEKSGLMALGRSDHIADAALFLGCSFRVGWGPNGVLYHSSTPVGQGGTKFGLSSCIQMERVALDRTVRDNGGVLKDELVELQFVSPLSLHLSMSQVVENPTEPAPSPLRLRTVVCSRTELPSVCNDYEDLVQKQLEVEGVGEADQVVLRHQRTVWQLIDVLFSETPNVSENEAEDEEVSDPMETPDDTAQILIRRAGFSRWLQESVGPMVQQDLEELKGNKYLKEIFTLLTGRKLDDAVEIALERGDVRMATLLSQAGGPIGMRNDVSAQLEVWASEGLDKSLIESDRLSVYQLLAGDLKGSLAGLNIDWKRFMGLVMWYQLKPDTDLPYLIETFEGLLENDHAPKPVPKYVEERVSVYDDYFEAQGYDTAYYLMLLHAKKSTSDTSVRRMLSASASTFDRLDQKLAWHQQGILHAIRMLEAEQLHEVHMNFASQLLSVGLCHWAVYVILHMPSSSQHPGLHEKAVKEILNQYCEIWSSSEAQQRFLEDDLGIPTEWLHEALALYWRYMRDNKKELEHLIKSRQWRTAHVLFMTSVAAPLFLSSEHSEIWQFASQLEGHLTEVEDWDLGAGIYIEFLTLKSSFLDKSNPVDGLETVEERTAAAAAFFERLKESQALWKSKSTLDIRVAYARMADEISTLLLGESKSQSVDKNTEMKMFDIVLDAPVPEDVRMCRLQGALSAFTKLISDEILV